MSEAPGEHRPGKWVVGVSLGSSRRDHRVELELLGQPVVIERRGVDGDIRRAIGLIRELDGRVDAFGLGGIDRYIWAGRRRYTFRDGERLARAARRSPVLDGSGLKNSLERWVVQYLQDDLGLKLQGRRVLLVSAVDRFGMAEALAQAGCEMLLGDLVFALGIPIPLRSLEALERAARVIAPIVVRLPFHMLYPVGKSQEKVTPKYAKLFQWAEIICGDFHLIRRFMPAQLEGKTILTNTVTAADVEELQQRGASLLITTTPDLGGRSFGTNVIEATLVALSGRNSELEPHEYLALLHRIGFRPRVVNLQKRTGNGGEKG